MTSGQALLSEYVANFIPLLLSSVVLPPLDLGVGYASTVLLNLNSNGVILSAHVLGEFAKSEHAVMWTILLVQAFLGVMISFLFKYADVMMKIYAVTGGIFFTTVLSWYYWNFQISGCFLVGYALYVLSSLLYYLSPDLLLKTI